MKNKLSLVGFLALMIGCLFLVQQVNNSGQDKQIEILEEAIHKAVVQCYALEGMYPPDLAYVEEHYGIAINHDNYIVHYDLFASNIMPDVKIIEKMWEE